MNNNTSSLPSAKLALFKFCFFEIEFKLLAFVIASQSGTSLKIMIFGVFENKSVYSDTNTTVLDPGLWMKNSGFFFEFGR